MCPAARHYQYDKVVTHVNGCCNARYDYFTGPIANI